MLDELHSQIPGSDRLTLGKTDDNLTHVITERYCHGKTI